MPKLSVFLKGVCKTLSVILVVTLIVSLLLLIFSQAFGIEHGSFLGHRFGVVATGSMKPHIPVGSFIVMKDVESSVLTVGDTVTFHSKDPTVPGGATVTHMIVRVETDANGNRFFVTKGTANPTEDQYPVYPDAVIGKVVYCSVVLGWLVRMIQGPYLFPILIGILVVNLIISFINVVKEAKKIHPDNDRDEDNQTETTV